jgi:tripartite-type tricarboxylate transporter receptor subunit TctC
MRKWLVAAALAVLAGFSAAAAAQSFPSKPLRLILPAGPGSVVDLRARQLASRLPDLLGQPVVIDNRPGGNGFLAAEAVARAPADGHTLLLGAQSIFAVNPWLFKSLPYRPDEDFAPVTLLSTGPIILCVNAQVPARSVDELVALARAKPDLLAYATSGRGAIGFLLMEQLKLKTGAKLLPVGYKATGAEIPDLVSGQIPVGLNFWSILRPHVESGKVRALAVADSRRLAAAPGIPSFAELGYPYMEGVSWQGIFVPAKTPPAIVATLQEAIARTLQLPEIRDPMVETGSNPGGNPSAEFAAFIRADRARMGRMMKEAGIAPE